MLSIMILKNWEDVPPFSLIFFKTVIKENRRNYGECPPIDGKPVMSVIV